MKGQASNSEWIKGFVEIASTHIGFIQLSSVEYPKFNSSVLVTEKCTG
jgi:hypothetical protein